MKLPSRNDLVLVSCLGVVAGMVGLSYAAVPLYYMFCRATGYGGTPTRAAAAPGGVSGHAVTVSFDTNVDPALDWTFQPETRSVTMNVGEDKLVYFRATNKDNKAIVGHAAFNVAPGEIARYFKKIQCFCFTEQRLEAGESVEMPVTFFVDPAILADRDQKNVTQITLSYTFYPSTVTKTASALERRGG